MTHPSPRAVRASWTPMVGLFGPRRRFAGGRLYTTVEVDLTEVAYLPRARRRRIWGAAWSPMSARREHKVLVGGPR